MDTKNGLIKTDTLRQLIEAAEAGNPRLEHIKNALPNFPTVWDEFLSAFNGDLNAAGRLHDTLLAGWSLNLALDCSGNCSVTLICQENRIEVTCDDQMKPAGAWLLAILRARLAEADQA